MNRLSSPIQSIKAHYDVIVIGSGYGGAIAASRLSRAGKKVCVLERGKERQPGEYPSTVLEGAEELQWNLPDCHQGSRTGLFDMHVHKDISVLVGCGLGGTSLINANVSIRPDARILEDPRWPAALRGEGGRRMNAGFELAETMLGANTFPTDRPAPPKLVALERSADSMGQKFYRLPINVTFTEGYNYAGVRQKACTLCGNCASGCNHGSKNTVLMNYLPDAKRHGAEIFAEASVRWVERGADGKWAVQYQILNTGREPFDSRSLFVTADIVIVAAGSLGSTEILLRSRDAGKLSVSSRLGHGFGGNGDVLGFSYNSAHEIRSVGVGQESEGELLDDKRAVGPCITGVIDMRGNPDWKDDVIMEEGVIPGVLASILPTVQRTAALLGGLNTSPTRALSQAKREVESAALGSYHGATANTQTYLGMCHDGGDGSMKLEQDRLHLAWPGIGSAPIIAKLSERLHEATKHLDGIYIANPIWSDKLGKNLITVHPLGGCNMADSAEGGVVDHRGMVFSGTTGTAVHEGLYVCDGAIVPTSVGVNPLLTISALAERCCMIIAEERGLTIDYSQRGPWREVAEHRAIGVRYTETMSGWFSLAADGDYEAAARRGKEQGSSIHFVLAFAADDLDQLIAGPDHEGRMVGTVEAPTLSPLPLTVTEGIVKLFVTDPGWPGARLMTHRMVLTAKDGRSYTLTGFKAIRERAIWERWSDMTTLYVTIQEGATESGKIVGKGIMKIAPDDFIRQLSTVDATNTRSAAQRSEATVKFGRYFAGALYDTYGGIAAAPLAALQGGLSFTDEGASPRKRRPLRASAPAFFPLKAPDGADLLLTRHCGGDKGPVILAHGMGTSSRIFSMDTIDTSLLEYLYAAGYDVWLFDHRASPLLPAAHARPAAGEVHPAEDVAQKDWPAAVARVRAETGARAVQVVAHDLGAMTFSMAMLSGLEGVRSAVCSQVATHLVTPRSSPLYAGLYAPDLAAVLGFKSLRDAAAGEGDWASPLYARALEIDRAGSASACESEVCNRISFRYGAPYEHAQLDELTHASIDELFGDASLELFEDIAAMARKGIVVNGAGEDVYLPHLDRLAIPIRFLHGAENRCFLPASTEKSVEALGARNGAALYSRALIAGYGHSDCIFGKNAATDVYPHILAHLEAT